MDLQLILQDPTTKVFHNLCDSLTPPTGTRQLLGLGLKFCLQIQLHHDCLHNTLQQITTDASLHFALQNIEQFNQNSGEYNPRLNISSGFEPRSADDHVELQLHSFTTEYKKIFHKHQDPRQNLLFYQEHALQLLQQDTRFRIVATDKNLGPALYRVGN
jgi:hypothetical protein